LNPGDARAPKISVVVPALNEAPSIERVVEGLKAQPLLASGEVIVVDNGSTDGTGEIATHAGARVAREERRGYGYACLAGVLAAEDAEVVVLLDGDAADDPDDLPRVLAPLLEGEADLVVGSRALGTRDRGSMTWQQVFGNKLASFMMRTIYGVRVTDVGPFRAVRREDLLALDMREMTYGWPSEMIVKAARAGYRYQEAPVSYRRRIGVSKVGDTIVNSLKVGWYIISTILRYSRWKPSKHAERSVAEARR
jgi:glycosyltransferase involved in cell wall biosynthesis